MNTGERMEKQDQHITLVSPGHQRGPTRLPWMENNLSTVFLFKREAVSVGARTEGEVCEENDKEKENLAFKISFKV